MRAPRASARAGARTPHSIPNGDALAAGPPVPASTPMAASRRSCARPTAATDLVSVDRHEHPREFWPAVLPAYDGDRVRARRPPARRWSCGRSSVTPSRPARAGLRRRGGSSRAFHFAIVDLARARYEGLSVSEAERSSSRPVGRDRAVGSDGAEDHRLRGAPDAWTDARPLGAAERTRPLSSTFVKRRVAVLVLDLDAVRAAREAAGHVGRGEGLELPVAGRARRCSLPGSDWLKT